MRAATTLDKGSQGHAKQRLRQSLLDLADSLRVLAEGLFPAQSSGLGSRRGRSAATAGSHGRLVPRPGRERAHALVGRRALVGSLLENAFGVGRFGYAWLTEAERSIGRGALVGMGPGGDRRDRDHRGHSWPGS